MEKTLSQITLVPVGRRIGVPVGATLLEAARLAGVEIVSICGGEGVCGACRVRPLEGELSPVTLSEEAELGMEDLRDGYRLACQTEVLGAARVELPPESLTTPQRLQLEGQESMPEGAALPALPKDTRTVWPARPGSAAPSRRVEFIETQLKGDPVIRVVDTTIPPPNLNDLRSDLTRAFDALAAQGHATARFAAGLLPSLADTLRKENWQVRLALRRDELVAILPTGAPLFGLAVDIGTTKLAAFLVNLREGKTAAKTGAMNPQISYGEDVISRIAYTNSHADGRYRLQSRLVETINQMVGELCRETGAARAQIVEAVLVGNTAMHHLVCGLPVAQLGAAPYVAAVSEPLEFPAGEIGLELASGAYVYLPPNIAGFVGADHVAMLLATEEECGDHTAIAMDIGTNTEISLFHHGAHYCCSCASGPAFEGAHIKDGMRAARGAIERVRIIGEVVHVYTIEQRPAVGICGSGILDAVAELRQAGLVDRRGVLRGQHPNLRGDGAGREFVLVPTENSGAGGAISVTRQDVNEIQLAKAAIRAGIEVLLAKAGIQASDVETFIVAGAFGTYLDVESALRIGMFPDLPRQRFRQVGNAAGGGARRLLLSARQRERALVLARKAQYVELANYPDFNRIYSRSLVL